MELTETGCEGRCGWNLLKQAVRVEVEGMELTETGCEGGRWRGWNWLHLSNSFSILNQQETASICKGSRHMNIC
jgi:hypothetical protein